MNTTRAVRLGIAAAGVALVLTGCKTVNKSDYDAAILENTELRERIAGLQGKVLEANQLIEACETEKQSLASQAQSLQMQLASRPATAAPVQTQAQSSSGFEHIQGVTVGGRADAISVEVAGDVLFSSGSAKLKSSAKSRLDQVASVLRSRYSGNMIRVEGYTDTDPIRKSSWKTNERLSSERALAVETYLVSKGVDADRIYAAAFGPANQRDSKQESRRVEIVVLGTS